MLSVGIHDHHEGARGPPDGRLHRRSIALVVRMPNDTSAGSGRLLTRVVCRPVVDHEDLMPARHVPKIGNELAYRMPLVERRDDDRRVGSDINHVAKRKLMMSPS